MKKIETPTAEELLRKIQKLEQEHANVKHKISNLTDNQYVNILESMGQSVHMFDPNHRIIYWNKMAHNLFGYTAEEVLGKTAPDVIIGPKYSELATYIIQLAVKGETWSGQFPVRSKYYEKITVITTLSPCRDANGTTFGVTCVCTDARQYRKLMPQSSVDVSQRISSGLDFHQPLPTAIVSKISNLASKVKLKMKTGETNMDHDSDFAPGCSTGEHFTKKPTTESNEGGENIPRFYKVLSKKAEVWMGKKGISCPWKRNENVEPFDIKPSIFGWPCFHNDQDQDSDPQTSSNASLIVESQPYESTSNFNKTPGSSWSFSCGTSSSWSIDSDFTNKTNIHIENLDVEIPWDDLTIREQIGQGPHGTTYHALLYGSDVAVKMFNKKELPDDAILSFRKEVCLMKRLRHPNILLFMGAVISPHHLCIVTEFPPRGSLFKLLQRSTTKLDWRRRVHMAMDIARGMNYLHRCQPPIIHRNLKSSNLLIDKNWTLKVADFGLSRIKHKTYLSTNTMTGTPQWMAPEVLRNEQVDEKSDVYSYGVVLWEITTGKIPWENLNLMQVVEAVGFMNQQLEIPDDVDPQWASLIKNCWSREPQSRPTFQEILVMLKDLQKKFAGQHSELTK